MYKNKVLTITLFLISTTLLYQSCKKDPTGYNPVNEVVLADNVVVIDTNTVTTPTLQGNKIKFTVDGTEPKLNVGDVIVLNDWEISYSSNKLNYKNINQDGSIKTSIIAIIESIEETANEISATISEGVFSNLVSHYNVVDVTPTGVQLYESLDGEVIYSGDYNGVNVKVEIESGYIKFDPAIHRNIDYSSSEGLSVFKLSVKGDLDIDCKFKITVDGSINFSKDAEIFTYILPIPFGPASGAAVFEFFVGASANLTTTGTVTSGFKFKTNVEYGAIYDYTGWNVIEEYGNPSPTGYEPKLTANSELEIRGYIKPQVYFSLWGMLGPYMSIEPYMNLNGNIDYGLQSWDWALVAGFDGIVGFKVDAFGFVDFADYNSVLTNYVLPLLSDSGELTTLYFDNFESYTQTQLVCQSNNNWTTWNNLPCDQTEDPYINTIRAHSGINSVYIIPYNDLVFNFDNYFTSGSFKISFFMYIPSGGEGYFNILKDFDYSHDWGMDAHFFSDGTGSLNGDSDVVFAYTQGSWIFIEVIVDLDNDLAQLQIDGTKIDTWQWNNENTINQLAAVDFYGSSNDYYWFDDFSVDYAEPLSDDQPQPPSTQIEFVNVPAGPHAIGSSASAGYINYDYQISKYEITNAQYVEFLNEGLQNGYVELNEYYVLSNYDGDSFHAAGRHQNYRYGQSDDPIKWNGQSFYIETGFEQHPPDGVNWFGAWSFANYYGYRLPTDEEWEKAARGQVTTDYSWGNNLDGKRANFYNSGDPWDNGQTPVGYYNGQNGTLDSPSSYGCYDMSGNVEEWLYSTDTLNRSIRGGGYPSADVKIEQKYSTHPNDMSNVRGFRVVK